MALVIELKGVIMIRRQSKSRNLRSGAVIVEMALVLPIFLMLVFGIIEFGRGFMVGQLVTNAAREGARRAILDGSTNADITSYIQTFMQQSANVSTADTTVTITVAAAPGNPPVSGNDVALCTSRDLVTVKVEVPFDKVAYISGKYLAGKKMTGQASMRHE